MNKTWIENVAKDAAGRAANNSGSMMVPQLLYAPIHFAIEDGVKELQKRDDEIQQILGKALGYPWYKDDQKNFPGTTEKDGVCVGDHVAVTIAEQAAAQIDLLKKKVELTEQTAVDFALSAAAKIGELSRVAQGWQDNAAMFYRGQRFYQDLIIRCGEAIGEEAFISDDGSVQEDVLALKVPELVEAMCKPKNRFLRALRIIFTGK